MNTFFSMTGYLCEKFLNDISFCIMNACKIIRPYSRDEILAILKEKATYLERDYHVQEIGLFGSIVRGEGTDTSDIDILVTFSKTPDLFTFVRLEQYLSSIFHMKVDLVLKDSLKRHIGEHILSEVVYE